MNTDISLVVMIVIVSVVSQVVRIIGISFLRALALGALCGVTNVLISGVGQPSLGIETVWDIAWSAAILIVSMVGVASHPVKIWIFAKTRA